MYIYIIYIYTYIYINIMSHFTPSKVSSINNLFASALMSSNFPGFGRFVPKNFCRKLRCGGSSSIFASLHATPAHTCTYTYIKIRAGKKKPCLTAHLPSLRAVTQSLYIGIRIYVYRLTIYVNTCGHASCALSRHPCP